jgi:hypothetical protein
MSHAPTGGQAPDQANSGRQTGAAVPPGRIIPKARNAASQPTSHTQHGDTRLANGPRPTDPPSLTVPEPRIMGFTLPGRCSECVRGRLPFPEALGDELGALLLAPAVQHLEV